jgi:pullulanase/glycogen debranching enzyme
VNIHAQGQLYMPRHQGDVAPCDPSAAHCNTVRAADNAIGAKFALFSANATRMDLRHFDDTGTSENARAGHDAKMAGKNGVGSGTMNRLITMAAGALPQSILVEMHRLGGSMTK